MNIRAGAVPTNGAVGQNGDLAHMRYPLINIMADHDHRLAIMSQTTCKLMYGNPPRSIEPGRRLIEDQNRRVHDDRTCDGNPSGLPTRQIQGITLDKISGYAKSFTDPFDHTGNICLGKTGVTGTERDLVIHRIEKKLRLGALK